MSDFFQWDKDKLTVFVEQMDAEHQVLIDLMNTLHREHEAGAGKDAVGRALTALVDYTVKHFADEEAYMESVDFPGIGTHKAIHKSLLEKLEAYGAEFAAGDGTLTDEFFGFLKQWLVAHIQGIDRKYGNHAKQPSPA